MFKKIFSEVGGTVAKNVNNNNNSNIAVNSFDRSSLSKVFQLVDRASLKFAT